jgi:hypothetical protein
MFRVYCFIDDAETYRYYYSKARIWSMWSHAALPLKLSEARQLAQSENAFYERIS